MKLVEKLADPTGFGDGVSHSTVFSLGTGTRDRVLPLGRPGDEVVTEVHTEARSRSASVRAAGPISVGVGDHGVRR